ncbi:MAG TPA: Fe-S cluster assembly protein HesB [Thermoanaerobaculia bacterium]|nr:Fe-S cluster assembly protein HesB [Thermoanaerobaculia bacterium]
MKIRLPIPSRFSFDAIVRSHGWYDLPPFAYDAGQAILSTAVAARNASASVRFCLKNGALEAQSDGLDRKTLASIAARVFSLDVDVESFALSLDPGSPLARAVARGGGRMLRAPGLFEDAVKMLLTTNCSWAATKGMVTRLIAEAGVQGAFPSPRSVAALSVRTLKERIRCGYRAPSLARFARRIASGRLDVSRWESREASTDAIRDVILAEHGFGPYAAEGLLRILGRHDYLAVDSWIRQKFRSLHRGAAHATDRAIARRYARYGRYKGLALWLEMTGDWHESITPSLRS